MGAVTTRLPAELLAHPEWDRSLPRDRPVHELDAGLFAVTGWRAVRDALTHPALLAEHPLKASSRAFGPNVLDCDGPKHRSFRALLAPLLSAGRVADYRDRVFPSLVESLVDDLCDREFDDFHGAVAHRIPYGIMCEVLGIEPALADAFHELTRPLARLLDYTTEETTSTHENMRTLLDMVEQQRLRPRLPPGSLLATIEKTRDRKGIRLSDDEVRSTALLFFLAGTETSSAFITSMVYCAGRCLFDPAELLEPDVRDSFLEEVLRLYPPVRTIVRFADDDVDLHGTRIRRHSAVLVSVAAANRDPAVFPFPDRFDLGRRTRDALPFAVGTHSCPGAPLAKTEFTVLLGHLVRRCGHIVVTRDRRAVTSQSFSHPTDFSVAFEPRKGRVE
jgi:cytochrome P450